MQLTFTTKNDIRKIFITDHMYGNLPITLLHFPQVFGDLFNRGYNLFYYLHNQPSHSSALKLYNYALNEDYTKAPELKKLLDLFSINLIDKNDIRFEKSKLVIEKFMESREGELSDLIKRIFDFTLPMSVNVVLCELYRAITSQGINLAYDPPIIGLSIPQDLQNNDIIDKFVHELMHIMMVKSKRLDYRKDGAKAFEEALIRYFTPRGIISKELKIERHTSLTKIRGEIRSSHRGQLFDFDNLMEIAEDYSKNISKQTIWDTLKSTKYKSFLL